MRPRCKGNVYGRLLGMGITVYPGVTKTVPAGHSPSQSTFDSRHNLYRLAYLGVVLPRGIRM